MKHENKKTKKLKVFSCFCDNHMQFWQNNITEKSFQTLMAMKNKIDFILIGGWAVYFYTKKMKSKDIDIILDYEELGKLKEKREIQKNDRLKKYEINMGEFDIDIYLPYYSKIGFPLEDIKKHIRILDGFKAPRVEILLALKLFAYHDRKNSIKGEKDKIDIISILDSVAIDWKFLKKIDKKYKSVSLVKELKEILSSINKVDELSLTEHSFSKLRLRILKEMKE